jgi:bifunctional DNase/RNase
VLNQLDVSIVRIAVTELKENTFHATITIQQNGDELEIDSRPSDAIALAVRAEAPIFAADDVIEESAIEFEGDELTDTDMEAIEAKVSEFKQFLEEVTPEDFESAAEDDDS